MQTLEEQVELQEAWHNGAQIDVRKHNLKTWMVCKYPTWLFEECEYRISTIKKG